jgi:PAS domain S-box-containing protein/diguanylate cyclase (GGDEF)-like protein
VAEIDGICLLMRVMKTAQWFSFGDRPARAGRISTQPSFHTPQCGEVGLRNADGMNGEARMTDRTEMLEAALEIVPDGVALLGLDDQLVFWNRAAEAIAGYTGAELLSRQSPEALKPLLLAGARLENMEPDTGGQLGHRTLLHARHKMGHDVPVMARYFVLRDELGGRMGMAVLFHPADSLDALPHGVCGQGSGVKESQAALEDRLTVIFRDFAGGGLPFGVLWITVDQAEQLRKTHGAGACETMLEKAGHAMENGLRPAEEMGRWGEDEFLVVSHERTPEMLAAHALTLAGLARTADFRWWGDRVQITVSIGAAQAEGDGSLVELLERAKAAMFTSLQAGGNQITSAPRRQECSQS